MCAEGDIDNRNTGSNDVKIMQEGARIHRKIQHSMGTMYHAEVPLKIEIPLVSDLGIEYVLQVEGRADGIIADINYDEDGNKEPESDAIIDEIKTMQTDVSLLKEPVYVHKAQALVYGYIYASQKKLSKIGIQMTYVTPEPETINKFLEEYTFERIEEWFNKLITGFKRWTDYTFDEKFGFRDYRGGGRSSGRETIGRVAAGAIAMKILKELGINITAYAKEIGGIGIDYDKFDIAERDNNAFNMPDKEAAEKVKAFAESKMSVGDSIGGVIECRVTGMMTGIGNPTFEKLDANLAKAIMSIGAVKGFEIGDGFEAAKVTGKYNNDEFVMKDGRVGKLTNHSGGVLGGISDGDEIVFRAAVKPTPSISALQETVNKQGEDIEVSIKGRHDPMIVPRAVVVVEAMTALTLVDLIFDNMTARMDRVKEFYRK